MGHFGDKSFQAINCTGTDNQKQGNTTLHTPETHTKKNRKTCSSYQNKALVWYASHDLRPGNGAGPILTVPEPTRGKYMENTKKLTHR